MYTMSSLSSWKVEEESENDSTCMNVTFVLFNMIFKNDMFRQLSN